MALGPAPSWARGKAEAADATKRIEEAADSQVCPPPAAHSRANLESRVFLVGELRMFRFF